MLNRNTLIISCLLIAVVLSGCSETSRTPVSNLDNVEHHTLRGNDFLMEEQPQAAVRSFELALSINAEYAPAQAGLATAYAMLVAQGLVDDEEYTELSLDALDEAFGNAEDDAQTYVAHLAGIRTYRLLKLEDWLEDSQEHFDDAISLNASDPQSYLFMARAYRDAYDLDEAEKLYTQIIETGRGLQAEASHEMVLVQKVKLATPGSVQGRIIAFEPKITRADLAALLVEEMRLKNLFTRYASHTVPFSAATDTTQQNQPALPSDILEHPLRSDIEEVLGIEIAGLEVYPSGLFNPDDVVTRAEYAMVLEDILTKITGEIDLKTRFVGKPSTFRDVRNDLPYANAIQTVSSRNIMQPSEEVRGFFGPLDPVSGADALIAIRKFDNEIKSMVR